MSDYPTNCPYYFVCNDQIDNLKKLVHKLTDELSYQEEHNKQLIHFIDRMVDSQTISSNGYLWKLKQLTNQLDLYKKTVNKIDDYCEYRAINKDDRGRIYEILHELTRDLKKSDQ